jgi:spermidine synthase
MTERGAAPISPSPRELVALALTAATVIAAQILLTRIFSFVTWHHFTPLIVGIALLGFGFAGSYLSVRGGDPAGDRGTFLRLVERDACGFALLLPVSLLVISQVRMNPTRIFQDPVEILWLAVYVLAAALPFGAAGLVICRLIDRYRARAGRVYGTDLAASAGGVLLGLGLLVVVGAETALILVAALAALAAVLVAIERGVRPVVSGALLLVLIGAALATGLARPDLLRAPPSKEMAAFAEHPELGQVAFEHRRWHPIARVDVTAEVVRHAPDFGGELSRTLEGTAPDERYRFLFQDGTAPSAYLKLSPPFPEIHYLHGYLQSAPYKIRPRARSLIIGLGGGIDVAIALAHGASAVTGIEVNPITLGLLTGDFADYCGVAGDPRVTLEVGEGRAFARASRETYDVIQLSGADTHAALVSGSGSLTEGYLYTVEAVGDFLDRLAPRGVLSYSRPFFVPPRETMKLVATADRALRLRGVDDPDAHIVVLGGRKWSETLISPSPFDADEVARLERFAARYGFKVFASPSASLPVPWDRYLELDATAAREFRQDYFFNVEPATDDRPFFYDYARWRKLLTDPPPFDFGIEGYYTVESPLGPLPVGNALLVVALVLVTLLATLCIVVPLARRTTELARQPAVAARVLAYFAALGLGFIAIEITLMQSFQLLLGGPALALGSVLFALLTGAGCGSLVAERLMPRHLRLVVPAIVVLLVVELVLLPRLIAALAAAPIALRVVATIAATAVPGFVMGMPFPLGIRAIAARGRALVPWAWAANGLLSVCGSVLTLLVAMMIGFKLVMAGAAAVYLLGWLALRPLARE